MIDDIYRVDGKYPDPHEIESRLNDLQTPGSELEYQRSVRELKSAGLDTHPLLRRFFVES